MTRDIERDKMTQNMKERGQKNYRTDTAPCSFRQLPSIAAKNFEQFKTLILSQKKISCPKRRLVVPVSRID